MNVIEITLQIIIALGIFNVWLLRFGVKSEWRGGNSLNMKEEFAVYGLPAWTIYVVGFLKILFAIGLLAGIWIQYLTTPSAIGTALLMLGAVAMHFKVGDALKKSLPAFTMLVLSLLVIVL